MDPLTTDVYSSSAVDDTSSSISVATTLNSTADFTDNTNDYISVTKQQLTGKDTYTSTMSTIKYFGTSESDSLESNPNENKESADQPVNLITVDVLNDENKLTDDFGSPGLTAPRLESSDITNPQRSSSVSDNVSLATFSSIFTTENTPSSNSEISSQVNPTASSISGNSTYESFSTLQQNNTSASPESPVSDHVSSSDYVSSPHKPSDPPVLNHHSTDQPQQTSSWLQLTQPLTSSTAVFASSTSGFVTEACNGETSLTLIANSGYITSPGFEKNQPYPPNLSCNWEIDDEENEVFYFTPFKGFETVSICNRLY